MKDHPGTASRKTSGGVNRRRFMQAGAAGAIGLAAAQASPRPARGAGSGRRRARSVILIFNVGGPSHIDLFDPKPDAPAEVRGPFKAIPTASPEFQLTELLPLHAKVADKFSLVRTVHHDATATHDTGHQLMQTGRLFGEGAPWPHAGCVASYLLGARDGIPSHVILPEAIGNTGGNLPHGQDAGFLGREHDPAVLAPDAWGELSEESASARERYGMNRFGQSCLMARRLVEAGVRFVTLNTFGTVFDGPTWDVHGRRPFATMDEMRDVVCPTYDRGYSALIEDLDQRGLLEETLVCNLAEFGRTPRINPAGGRDHWTKCWSVYFAGGGVQGGRVVGKSDALGAYPLERPVTPAEVVATIYHALRIESDARLPGVEGQEVPVVEAGRHYIKELF